jgi:putative oxidoreductase
MWTLQFLGKLQGILPLLLRAVVGGSFALVHGYDKIMGPNGFDGGKAWVDDKSKLAPAILLYVATWTEFLAGVGILAGLLTRWAALGIVAVMAYAIFGVHWKDGFEAYEKALAFVVLCVGIMAVGPGSLSLDRLFFQKAALNP